MKRKYVVYSLIILLIVGGSIGAGYLLRNARRGIAVAGERQSSEKTRSSIRSPTPAISENQRTDAVSIPVTPEPVFMEDEPDNEEGTVGRRPRKPVTATVELLRKITAFVESPDGREEEVLESLAGELSEITISSVSRVEVRTDGTDFYAVLWMGEDEQYFFRIRLEEEISAEWILPSEEKVLEIFAHGANVAKRKESVISRTET